jgi:hypothetical protein
MEMQSLDRMSYGGIYVFSVICMLNKPLKLYDLNLCCV